MALELGESVLEDLLGVEDSNSTEGDDVVHMGDCLKSSLGDEFFHSKEEFGVSTSFEQSVSNSNSCDDFVKLIILIISLGE